MNQARTQAAAGHRDKPALPLTEARTTDALGKGKEGELKGNLDFLKTQQTQGLLLLYFLTV